ncbi:hypothetical protein DFLDMN_001069 [Cupriavidus sp. H19C3]|uniref:hypothetical protein n=1 Tax=Cupriavidus sp. H19C3 TaxID=3241603 RepID=UPI003BF8EF9E
MIETGELIYGIEFPPESGVFHHAFSMRLPTIDDNVAAIEEVGSTSSIRINVAMFARCLESLGTIPKDSITTQLVGTLIDDDYDELAAARDRLKKKRKTSSSTSRTTDSESSSSAATELPSQPSGA